MARRRAQRRRAGGDAVTTIYWRDIPAQVTATIGETTAKELLAPRFQHAIDRAATVADLTETEAYVAQWRRQTEPIDDASSADPASLVTEAAAELDATYPRQRLETLVAQGGVEPASEPATETQP